MKMMAILAAALAGACAAGTAVQQSESSQREFERAIAGRTAGAPVSCVSVVGLRGGGRSLGGDAILFEGPGNVVYVNRLEGGCPVLRAGHAIRTQTPASQLCRGDIAIVFDPTTGIEYGGCPLGDFVPYRRAA